MVYNGEIFNSEQLRREMEINGIKFDSRNSDTEVLFQLLQNYDFKIALNKLNGMFAFAFLDLRLKKLFIARDKVGIKPLYYSKNSRHFRFSSELKSLTRANDHKPEINMSSVRNYLLRNYVPGPDTIYEHYFKLKPGHLLIYDIVSHSSEIQKWWEPAFHQGVIQNKSQAVEAVRETLERSVIRWSQSDQKSTAISLSGGLDSTIIAAIAKKMVSS